MTQETFSDSDASNPNANPDEVDVVGEMQLRLLVQTTICLLLAIALVVLLLVGACGRVANDGQAI